MFKQAAREFPSCERRNEASFCITACLRNMYILQKYYHWFVFQIILQFDPAFSASCLLRLFMLLLEYFRKRNHSQVNWKFLNELFGRSCTVFIGLLQMGLRKVSMAFSQLWEKTWSVFISDCITACLRNVYILQKYYHWFVFQIISQFDPAFSASCLLRLFMLLWGYFRRRNHSEVNWEFLNELFSRPCKVFSSLMQMGLGKVSMAFSQLWEKNWSKFVNDCITACLRNVYILQKYYHWFVFKIISQFDPAFSASCLPRLFMLLLGCFRRRNHSEENWEFLKELFSHSCKVFSGSL